jgi:ubiquinone/menaquinone biosynthesis C-methylase UbiE
MGALYDDIGAGYDTTRRADPFLTSRLVALLGDIGMCPSLDVACGSGNYTLAMAARGIDVHGTDRSGLMITAAAAKPHAGVRAITWSVADAALLPFPNGTFGGATCTLALHHFPALGPVFAQVRRVLSSGRFVMFTATREQMAGYWLREYFPQAMKRSAEQMPALDDILVPLRSAGFTRIDIEAYDVTNDLADLFLYSGKYRPAMYLDAGIRANISTFAALADPAEVARGCASLARDIQTGRISDVAKAYQSSGGDYMFVIAHE